MFTTLFVSILKSVAIPIVAFIILQPIFGDRASFLIVTITLTVTNVLSIIWQLLKILPNLVLLKGGKIIRLILTIFIEVASVVGFWLYYLANFR